MTREEQIKTLGDLLLLEVAAQRLTDNINKIKVEKFRKPPKAPESPKEVVPLYPTRWLTPGKIAGLSVAALVGTLLAFLGLIGPSLPSVVIAVVISVIVLGVLIGVYVSRTPGFKMEIEQAEQECKAQNERIRQEYDLKRKIYNEEHSRYISEKNAWTADHETRLNDSINQYNLIIDEINDTYNTSKIIPLQYRSVPVISYLYDYMSSSEAELHQGLVSYDSQVQQRLTQSHITEQQIANEIAERQAELTMEQNMIAARQNELAEESNKIAERTRREQNIMNAIQIIQGAQTNSLLRKANTSLGDIKNEYLYGD